MKVLVIGGVAAGTKVAAKLKREDRGCEVTVLTKGEDISYAGCGLPYYVGDVIHEKGQLIVNTPESFCKTDRGRGTDRDGSGGAEPGGKDGGGGQCQDRGAYGLQL